MTDNSQGFVRTTGRWSLTALMLNSIIGAAILGLPAVLAERLGGFSPLSCLGAGAGILIIAACIAEVSSRYEETGGLYLYARDAALLFSFAALGNFRWNATLSAVSRLAVYGAMALAVPVLRARKDPKAQLLIPAPYFFAGFTLLSSLILFNANGTRGILHRGYNLRHRSAELDSGAEVAA